MLKVITDILLIKSFFAAQMLWNFSLMLNDDENPLFLENLLWDLPNKMHSRQNT